jgi:hypothetical protein
MEEQALGAVLKRLERASLAEFDKNGDTSIQYAPHYISPHRHCNY